MKKYILILVTMLLCLSMLACDANPVPPETGGTENQSNGWATASEKDHDCLCFLDVENGINVVLCAKVGCPHDNSQFDINGEPIYCEAYILGELQFFWEGKLYYTTENDYGIFLYRRKSDGTAEEQVMQLCVDYTNPEQALNLSSCYFVDGVMYYQVNVSSIEQIGSHVNYEIQDKLLMRLDLQTKKEECIMTTKTDASQTIFGLHRESLLYSVLLINPEFFDLPLSDPKRDEYYADSSRQIIRFDIVTGKEEILMQKHFSETLSVREVSGDTLLYNVREDGRMVARSLNLTTGEDTLLHEREIVPLNENFAFAYEGEGEGEILWLMNRKTGELLPTAYQDLFMYPGDIGQEGMILVRRVRPEGSSRNKRIYAYVTFASLADGLQEEDFVDFFIWG